MASTSGACGGAMLHDFITEHRTEIIARCRSQLASRRAPRPTDDELEFGVPLFLDQIADTLRSKVSPSPSMHFVESTHDMAMKRIREKASPATPDDSTLRAATAAAYETLGVEVPTALLRK